MPQGPRPPAHEPLSFGTPDGVLTSPKVQAGFGGPGWTGPLSLHETGEEARVERNVNGISEPFEAGAASGRACHPAGPPGDALGTALWLLGRGLWPVPMSPPDDRHSPSPGKAPLGRGWGKAKPSPARLRAVYRHHPGAGVGLLLGPDAGVIDLETDDPEAAAAELRRLFPAGMPPTMGWRSERGEHRLFAWDERLRGLGLPGVVTLAGGALELRLGGAGKQVASVCPPSMSAGGRARTWNGCWFIVPLPRELAAQVRRLGRSRRGRSRSRPVPHPCPGGRVSRYAAAALEREVEAVRGSEPGCRNRTLNRAAFSLGQLVAAGALSRGVVEWALRSAARDCGLGEREAERTIRGGIEAGLLTPRIGRG